MTALLHPSATCEVAGIEFREDHDNDEGRGPWTLSIDCCLCATSIEQRKGDGPIEWMQSHAELHVDCYGCDETPLASTAFMASLHADGGPKGSNPLVPFCNEDCYDEALSRAGERQDEQRYCP